ncbi:MAG TPA: PHP domain-containing protein [Ignavibacteriaceae bacterium]|nr:PHP domain-containing protein [Ignavibacteriaceae bacterium]
MIHINVHSNHSLLSGTSTINELVDKAVSFNMNSLCLTDTNGMYGLISFAKRAIEKGIKPIFGAYIDEPNNSSSYVIILAKNDSGYSDLCKIITSRKLNDDFTLKNIVKKFKDLFIITPDVNLLEIAKDNKNIFGELILTPSYKSHCRLVYDYCIKNRIKYIASNPIYFNNPEDYELHKIVTAIGLNTTVSNLKEDEITDSDFYFADPKELIKKCKGIPEAIQNLNYIEDNCNVDLKLHQYKFPNFPSPIYETSESMLTRLCYEGAEKKYKVMSAQVIKRLNYELQVIKEMNFVDYFLIVWDIVKEAQKRGMMFIGRGSAANSIVAYCIGLTQVDPLEHNLYFERFLNKGRSSPPDVDIDFSWKERDEIIKYVFDKYGYENVAMISTHVTFRAKSAFREVAKVYGFSNDEITKFSKFIPWTNAKNLLNISNIFPESRSLKFNEEPWISIIKYASQLADYPRHLSIHPSGIIITPESIVNYVALEYASNKGLGLIITQPDMYSIEDLGLIKIDLLSQRSLGVLRDTILDLKAKKK